MAFDLTKPSMAAVSWSAALGDIRDNFRAIVQGDDNVFSNTGTMILRIRSSGTATPAILSAYSGNGTTSARASYVQVVANETSPQDWRFGMVGTKDFVVNNSTASRNDLTILTTGAAFFGTNLGIGVTPSVRLQIGVGGTGTQAEQVYVDSGSGAGGQASYHLLRNSVLKATFGLVASASSLISGSAVNELAIVNTLGILFSADSGATLHAKLDGSGNFAIGTAAALTDRLHVKKNETNATFGSSTQFRMENSQGSGNFVGLHFAGAVSDGFIAFMDHSTTATRRIGFGCRSSNEDFIIDGNGNVVLGSLAALATTATDGFGYIPTCAGTPTGTPTAKTGKVPLVFDTTGVKLWIYTGGAWKGVVVA